MSFTKEGVLVSHVDLGDLGGYTEGVDRQVKPKLG